MPTVIVVLRFKKKWWVDVNLSFQVSRYIFKKKKTWGHWIA